MAYTRHAREGYERCLEPRDMENGLERGDYERAADATLATKPQLLRGRRKGTWLVVCKE